MPTCRIHITGASGSGTTTLGRALATALAVPHHDSDDYYWLPTEPPYSEPRPVEERLRLMHDLFVPRTTWVLSGSLVGWGDPLTPLFDLVVFLRTEAAIRVDRLRLREAVRYGAPVPGSSGYARTEAFLAWAKGYDDGDGTGRSLVTHERWLAALPCPILRLDSGRPTAELATAVMARLHPDRMTGPDPDAISPLPTDHGVPPA